MIVPGDPQQKTGGYGYVRRIVETMSQSGTAVSLLGLSGQFPIADETAALALDDALNTLGDGAVAVIDGLALGNLPEVAEKHQHRLCLVALVHHPLADETGLSEPARNRLAASERLALAAVRGVIVTSAFTARRLSEWDVDQERIQVVQPGVDRPQLDPTSRKNAGARGKRPSAKPLRFLCVGSVTPRKGQDVLINALAACQSRDWHCDLVGSLSRDTVFAETVQHAVRDSGLADAVSIHGELDQSALEPFYQSADLLIVPSWYEGYGMVVTEALAHGLPVLASSGGALADTLPPQAGLFFAPGDVEQLAAMLGQLADNPTHLQSLTRQARAYSAQLRSWDTAADEFKAALAALTAGVAGPPSRQQTAFADDWLNTREPHDHAARADDLAIELNAAIQQGRVALCDGKLGVVDLGAGTGSNFRYLASKLAINQSWRLVDQDRELLQWASDTPLRVANDVTMTTCALDITAAPEQQWLPNGTGLVTASALLDLVTEAWLEKLVKRMVDVQAAGLFSLSYDGNFSFNPPLPEDEWVRGLVNAHQQADKSANTGSNRPHAVNGENSLGPGAVAVLDSLLQAGGFAVTIRATPWRLGPGSETLQRPLIAGWCEAAREMAPDRVAEIENWQAQRLDAVGQGACSITVGHQDLLALPQRNRR